MQKEEINEEIKMPVWFGDNEFHKSHRQNLLRKDPIHYGKEGWSEDPNDVYRWYDMNKNKWYSQKVGTSIKIY